MAWPRRRRTIGALLAAYLLGAAALVWSPVPLTQPLAPLLYDYGALAQQLLGVPPGWARWALEFAANVVLFVPPALLVTLWLRRDAWPYVVAAGACCSIAVELVQLAFLPDRSATVGDVVANSLGALLGALLAHRLRRS